MNILNATFLAMRRAFEALPERPQAAFVDGNRLPGLPVPSKAIIKGRLSERVNSRRVDNGEGQQGQIYALSRRAVSGILLQKAQGLRHEAAL